MPEQGYEDDTYEQIEMMVLELLRRQPMHGYALAQYIRERSDELREVSRFDRMFEGVRLVLSPIRS